MYSKISVKPMAGALGAEPFGGASDDFRKFVGSEIAFWAPVIKNSGAVAD